MSEKYKYKNEETEEVVLNDEEEEVVSNKVVNDEEESSSTTVSSTDEEKEDSEVNIRCELCGTTRERTNLHHLIPKLVLKRRRNHGNKDHPTVLARLCKTCHRTLHAKFNHATLSKGFSSIEQIENQPEIEEYLTRRRAEVERREGWVKQ
jgi:hypothetical protein